MEIAGFLNETLIDYPGKLASEVFTTKCSYNCPSCHSLHIVNGTPNYSEQDILDYLDRAKGLIEGIVICGGEPTKQKDLVEFTKKIKERGLAVKLDTNGSNPEMLKNLLENNLIDYVAMDIKCPKELYPQLTGIKKNYSLEVEQCMGLLSDSNADYELRTTIVPLYEDGKLRWLNEQEIQKVAEWISDKSGPDTKYFLQKFIARAEGEMICNKFSKLSLPEEFCQTPISLLDKMQESTGKYLTNCKVRRR